jgi:2-phospho-L-lactate transferase/gluconeogenesis factor (CofD/UPF0052 family)/choline kinase
MIITIITGGSGSTNIQTGLYKICPELSINLLINGYDDGKSTGILRKLFPNTLGISDFRKNQILEYKLLYGENSIYKLLNNRFTNINPYNYVINLINNTDFDNNDKLKNFLINNTKYFFELEQSKKIDYEDFSFTNIIYCALLNKNNNDMEVVCDIIKIELKLKNNIYLNSNENLILKGITKNGNILINESSIIDFNDKNDKIIDIFFDKDFPVLNKNTEELLFKSDIILFSCGTQFSSLIPTYKTLLFKETINKSKALKFIVLNCEYDNDIINYSGNELLDKINEYLPLNDMQIIISNNMNIKLFPTNKEYNYINIPLLIQNGKHIGFLIWEYIFNYYFKNYYNNLKIANNYATNLFLKSIIVNEKKYDFCIIVGGINKRMNINYPKCLIKVDNEIVLMKIINNIIPYAKNIFICGNNYYKNSFIEFEKLIKNYNNIIFLYFNSIDNSQTYPKGSGETIFQLLNNVHYLTDKIFIMWGDIIISDNKIIEEMYNNEYNNNFLIPTKYEKNPYAYLIIDNKNKVKNIKYKKDIDVNFGYHDQCIFLCDKNKIKEKLHFLINQDYDELNFLDILKYLDNIYYYETNYPLKSFNTIHEL